MFPPPFNVHGGLRRQHATSKKRVASDIHPEEKTLVFQLRPLKYNAVYIAPTKHHLHIHDAAVHMLP